MQPLSTKRSLRDLTRDRAAKTVLQMQIFLGDSFLYRHVPTTKGSTALILGMGSEIKVQESANEPPFRCYTVHRHLARFAIAEGGLWKEAASTQFTVRDC